MKMRCYAGGVFYFLLATFDCIGHALLASPFKIPSQVKKEVKQKKNKQIFMLSCESYIRPAYSIYP
jgi:hypothetical protein